MTYAIIETGGKQLRVEPGRFYDIELLTAEPDQTVSIENVLLVQHNGDVTIGQPFVTGAKVEGTVLRHLRGRKVLVYKMKPKKKTRKKRGHRQEITRLMINSISLNGSVIAEAEERADETAVAEVSAVETTASEIEVAAEPIAEAETPAETNEAAASEETSVAEETVQTTTAEKEDKSE